MSKLPDLEGWAVFARVAEKGGFAAASAELGLSTATVSKAVARLEARIGAPLFARTSRRVALTALGRALAADAGRLLAETEAMETGAASGSRSPRGVVRIAAPMSFGVTYVAPLLPGLLARFPELRVDLALSDEVVDLVGMGFDAALRLSPRASPSLRTRRICAIATKLVAAPSWVARNGAPSSPASIDPTSLFAYAYSRTPDRVLFRHAESGEEISVATAGRIRVNNGDAMLPSLVAGAGIAMLPDFIVWDALRDGRLVTLLDAWRTGDVSLNVVTPPGGPRPLRVTVTIDHLAAALARAPWAAPEAR